MLPRRALIITSFFFWFKSVNALKDKIERFESTLTRTTVSSALDTVRQLASRPIPLVDLGFGRLCSKKKHIMLLAVLIFFRNYAKILHLSKNYALCHRDYAISILH